VTCKIERVGNVQTFTCGPKKKRGPCSECARATATTECTFEFWGKKLGQTCSKTLCDGCKVNVDGVTMCPSHARMEGRNV